MDVFLSIVHLLLFFYGRIPNCAYVLRLFHYTIFLGCSCGGCASSSCVLASIRLWKTFSRIAPNFEFPFLTINLISPMIHGFNCWRTFCTCCFSTFVIPNGAPSNSDSLGHVFWGDHASSHFPAFWVLAACIFKSSPSENISNYFDNRFLVYFFGGDASKFYRILYNCFYSFIQISFIFNFVC